MTTLIILIVIAAIAISSAIIWFAGRSVRQAKKLIATGTPADAKIIQILNPGQTVKGAWGIFFLVLLEVVPANGASFQIKKTLRSSSENASTIQPGNIIKIFIDPKDPHTIAIPGTDDTTPTFTFR